ncbi:hypothetical protein [Pontibacter mucosus]|nr:hypothetical protein [Pontibacter mucosus]
MVNLRMPSAGVQKPFISDEYLQVVVEFHKEHPAFAKRPITTYLSETLDRITSLSIGEAFTAVSFVSLLLCGVALYYLAALTGSTAKEAALSIIGFFSSFSILFAFFPPIYTYDEPIHYLLVYMSLIFLRQERWLPFIFLFSLSLVARESSLILLPGAAMLVIYADQDSKTSIWKLSILLAPVAIYVLYLVLFITGSGIEDASKQDFVGRLEHFKYNFQSIKFALEALLSFFLALGFQTYLLCSYASRKHLSVTERKFIAAFIITLALNTVIVYFTTWARESRLLALPLLFLWPILGKIAQSEFQYIKAKVRASTHNEILRWLPLFTTLAIVIIYITQKVYFQTIGSISDNLFNEYTAIILIFLVAHAILRFMLKPKSPMKDER